MFETRQPHATVAHRPAETGTVFVMAVIAMAAVISFGVAFLEIATFQLHTFDGRLTQLQAEAIAQGGLEIGLATIEANPNWTHPILLPMGRGYYRTAPERNNGVIEVVSRGTFSGVSVTYRARVESSGDVLDTRHTFVVGNDAKFRSDTQVTWGGELLASKVVDEGGVFDGVSSALDAVPGLSVDFTAASAAAETVLPKDSTLKSGTLTGIIYAAGDLTINGSVKIVGTIIVEDKLTIDAAGGDVAILSDSHECVVVTGQNLDIKNVGSLTISGIVVAGNDLNLKQISKLSAVGAAVVDHNMHLEGVVGEWSNSTTAGGDPPLFVSGGLTRSMLRERWLRRD